MPRLFPLTKGGKGNLDIIEGATINTPSMLAVEDALDGLRWAESLGGLKAVLARSHANLAVLDDWVEKTPWVEFLAKEPAIRSSTSVCLAIVDPAFMALDDAGRQGFVKDMTRLLSEAKVAYDIQSYRDAPAGLRIWCGATVETSDLEALISWLAWAFAETKSRLA